MTPEDERPMAERRELPVKARRKLMRERSGAVIPTAPAKAVDDMTLDDLSAPMRRALILAHYNGIRPGEDDVLPQTVAALERRDLIHKRTSKKGRASYRPTDVGRGLIMRALPVFLHRRLHRNYTSDPAHAVRGEEACLHDIDAGVLAPPPTKKREPEGTLAGSIKAMKERQATEGMAA